MRSTVPQNFRQPLPPHGHLLRTHPCPHLARRCRLAATAATRVPPTCGTTTHSGNTKPVTT